MERHDIPKVLLRYWIAILGLVICFVVEWEILDRLTKEAYEFRYQMDLEEFRQNPTDYFPLHNRKEAYNDFFIEQLDAVMKEIEEASAFYKYTSTFTLEHQTILFQILNEEKGKIAETFELDDNDINFTANDIAEEVKNLLLTDRIYGLSLDVHTDTYIKRWVAPYTCRRSSAKSSLANQIRYSIIEEINTFLKRNARTLKLSFDKDGLQTLSSFLENSIYTHRNYTFSNDWSLSQYQKSDVYLKVCKQNDNTLLVKTNRIHQYMYFNADSFHFSVKLSTASFAELSASECERFLEDLRAFNGQYNVDGILYPKEKAVELIRQLYVKTNASFKLYTDLSKDDVVRIIFDRKKAAEKLSDRGTEP